MSVARRKSLLIKEPTSGPQTAFEVSEELKEIVGDKINTYMLSVFLTDEKIVKVGSVQQKLGPLLRQRWLVLTDKPRLLVLNGNIFEKKNNDDIVIPDVRKRISISQDSRRLSGAIKDTISENTTVEIKSEMAPQPIEPPKDQEIKVSRRKSVLNYFSKEQEPSTTIQTPITTTSTLGRRKSVLQFLTDKFVTDNASVVAEPMSRYPVADRRASNDVPLLKPEHKPFDKERPSFTGDMVIANTTTSQLKSSKSIKKPNSTDPLKPTIAPEVKQEESKLEVKSSILIDESLDLQEIKEKNTMLLTSGTAKYLFFDDKHLENWVLAIQMVRSLANPNVMFAEFIKM